MDEGLCVLTLMFGPSSFSLLRELMRERISICYRTNVEMHQSTLPWLVLRNECVVTSPLLRVNILWNNLAGSVWMYYNGSSFPAHEDL